MRIKQITMHSNLSKIKNKILQTCLQGNYRDSLGEFSNTSNGVFGAEMVNYENIYHLDSIPSCFPLITSACVDVKWNSYFIGMSTRRSSRMDSWSAFDNSLIPAVARMYKGVSACLLLGTCLAANCSRGSKYSEVANGLSTNVEIPMKEKNFLILTHTK